MRKARWFPMDRIPNVTMDAEYILLAYYNVGNTTEIMIYYHPKEQHHVRIARTDGTETWTMSKGAM